MQLKIFNFCLLYLVALANCSLMAIGPPAAPAIRYLRSTETNDNTTGNFELHESVIKYSNQSSGINGNLSMSYVNDIEYFDVDYWFMVDPKFQNKVTSRALGA